MPTKMMLACIHADGMTPGDAAGPIPKVDATNEQSFLSFATDATNRFAYFKFVMPPIYTGGTLKADVIGYMETATSGDIKHEIALWALSNADSVASQDFDTLNEASPVTVPGTIKQRFTTTITLSNKDSVAAEDTVYGYYQRDSADAGDTTTGNFWLEFVHIYEEFA